MDIDASEDWNRRDYDGVLSDFNIYPPLLTYENEELATRVLAKPLVKRVDSSDSQITMEELQDRVDPSGSTGSEVKQTHWFAAVEDDQLPVVLWDAPVSDGRFDDLEWRVAVQPVKTPPESRDGSFRPDTEQVPVVSFDCRDRSSAMQLLRFLLARDPRFDDDDPTWIP